MNCECNCQPCVASDYYISHYCRTVNYKHETTTHTIKQEK